MIAPQASDTEQVLLAKIAIMLNASAESGDPPQVLLYRIAQAIANGSAPGGGDYDPAAVAITGGTIVGTTISGITIAGTGGSTLNVGAGGTLGTAAFTAATAYVTPTTLNNATLPGSFTTLSASGAVTLSAATSTTISGVVRINNTPGNIQLWNGAGFGFSSTTDPVDTMDVIIRRDAANTLALRNGTAAQTLNVYNTWTDASNYERGFTRWSSNNLEIGTGSAGTGVARNLVLRTDGAASVVLAVAGVNRFFVDGGTGNFLAATDNTYDIGASGATRPRNGYFGSNVFIGPTQRMDSSAFIAPATGYFYWDTRSVIASPSNGVVKLSNLTESDFSRLQFGGTTSSFPALKRSGSDVEIVKADGTAADTAIILASPDGTRYRISVANGGAVTSTAA